MAKNNKNKGNSFLPPNASQIKTKIKYLNKDVDKLTGWKQTGNNANVFVSLRFVQHEQECFSNWSKNEMRVFWSFQDSLSNFTWQQVYSQSGKTNKTGFGYTEIDKKQYPKTDFREQLSDDITLFELRVDQTKRVHGFRHESIFYIFWLDKNHNLLN